jgi:hypothetical protein
MFGISSYSKLLAVAGTTARERFVGSDRVPDASQAQAEPFQDTRPAQLRHRYTSFSLLYFQVFLVTTAEVIAVIPVTGIILVVDSA